MWTRKASLDHLPRILILSGWWSLINKAIAAPLRIDLLPIFSMLMPGRLSDTVRPSDFIALTMRPEEISSLRSPRRSVNAFVLGFDVSFETRLQILDQMRTGHSVLSPDFE